MLQRIPFVIPFDVRVQVFNLLLQKDKDSSNRGTGWVPGETSINLRIRRDYTYEDAFDKLRPENGTTSANICIRGFQRFFLFRLEPNLRHRMRIQFINAVGLDEAGIDGGGLFREFMNELLKTAFNPNRGLFKLTSDGYLYPNPNVAFIEENFGPHFNFLGRILAKVRTILPLSNFSIVFVFVCFSSRPSTRNISRNYPLLRSFSKKFSRDHPAT